MEVFQFPSVTPGRIVDFMTHQNAAPLPLMVLAVGDDSVDGVVFVVESSSLTFVSGVRHLNDPRLKDPAFMYALMQEGDAGLFKVSDHDLSINARLTAIEDALFKVVCGKKAEAEVAVRELLESRPEDSRETLALPNEAPIEVVAMAERFKGGKVDPAEKAAAIAAAKAL